MRQHTKYMIQKVLLVNFQLSKHLFCFISDTVLESITLRTDQPKSTIGNSFTYRVNPLGTIIFSFFPTQHHKHFFTASTLIIFTIEAHPVREFWWFFFSLTVHNHLFLVFLTQMCSAKWIEAPQPTLDFLSLYCISVVCYFTCYTVQLYWPCLILFCYRDLLSALGFVMYQVLIFLKFLWFQSIPKACVLL